MSEKKRVLLACPAKHALPWYWVKSLVQLLATKSDKYEFDYVTEAGNNAINIARNIIADHAIKSPRNYWKMVMVDSDAHWSVEQFLRLLEHEEPFVAGPYCRKTGGPVSWLCVRTKGTEIRPDGMMECDFLGTHFFAYEIEALKKVVAHFPERVFTYDDEHGQDSRNTMCELFPIGIVGANTPEGRLRTIKKVIKQVEDGEWGAKGEENFWGAYKSICDIATKPQEGEVRMLGEDYHFCHLARQAGFKLYCDRDLNPIGHVGDIIYPVGPNQNSVAQEFPFNSTLLDQW